MDFITTILVYIFYDYLKAPGLTIDEFTQNYLFLGKLKSLMWLRFQTVNLWLFTSPVLTDINGGWRLNK